MTYLILFHFLTSGEPAPPPKCPLFGNIKVSKAVSGEIAGGTLESGYPPLNVTQTYIESFNDNIAEMPVVRRYIIRQGGRT